MKRIIVSILSVALLSGIFVDINFLTAFATTDGFEDCRKLNKDFITNLYCYVEKAKEKIKMGEKHVTVQNEKNIPDYRLELFRYTALDEIIPSLSFEKEPHKFIESKYGSTFNLIKNIATGAGLILGAIFGVWLPKGVSYLKSKLNVQDSNKSTKAVDPLKNSKVCSKLSENKKDKLIKFVSIIIGSGLFAFLSRTLAESGILNFEDQKYNKLKIDKENSLLAMGCLSDDLLEDQWKNSDCILIKTDLSKDCYESIPSFLKIGVNYSSEETKKAPKDFEKLKYNLDEILKNNK